MRHIKNTSPTERRIGPETVAKALGAEIVGPAPKGLLHMRLPPNTRVTSDEEGTMDDITVKRDRVLALEKELAEARLDILKTFPAFHRDAPHEDILGWARMQLNEAFGEPFEDEMKRAKDWVEKHYGEECPLRGKPLGTCPAVLSLSTRPSSIATFRSLKCLCGAEVSLIDLDKV